MYRYEKTKAEVEQKERVDFYFAHLDFVTKWDLVNSSCYQILGHFYWKKEKTIFYELADSGHDWGQQVAMISSFYCIKKGEFSDDLTLTEKFKNHPHDFLHKAAG